VNEPTIYSVVGFVLAVVYNPTVVTDETPPAMWIDRSPDEDHARTQGRQLLPMVQTPQSPAWRLKWCSEIEIKHRDSIASSHAQRVWARASSTCRRCHTPWYRLTRTDPHTDTEPSAIGIQWRSVATV